MISILETRVASSAPRRPRRLPWAASWRLRNDLEALGVQVVEDENVLDYLADHPDMVEPLVELSQLAREEFGPWATLELSWREDSGAEYLQLLLRLASYEEDVGEQLRSVWWSAQERGYFERSGWIVLTTDHELAV
jgi:hypothetical protein